MRGEECTATWQKNIPVSGNKNKGEEHTTVLTRGHTVAERLSPAYRKRCIYHHKFIPYGPRKCNREKRYQEAVIDRDIPLLVH
jgi:hypothetical protein